MRQPETENALRPGWFRIEVWDTSEPYEGAVLSKRLVYWNGSRVLVGQDVINGIREFESEGGGLHCTRWVANPSRADFVVESCRPALLAPEFDDRLREKLGLPAARLMK